MKLALPDCRTHRDVFTLSAEERRELVRRIAEEGPDAIEAFIREREKTDSLIARKVQKLRDELMRRARELKEKLSGEYQERQEALEADFRTRLAQVQQEKQALNSRLQSLGSGDSAAFEAALRANPTLGIALDADLSSKPPLHRRIWRAIVRFVRLLLFPLLWLLRKLFPAPKRHDKRVHLLTPTAGGVLARAGDLYLADSGFRAAVRARLDAAPPQERIRRAWERLLGREDYETLAQKAMEQMMDEEADRLESERDAQARRMREELEALAAREREAESRRLSDRQALREAEERDARHIEESLRAAPEEQVREAIVDELRSVGLLRQQGEELMPTLQFMDRFASLVYDEETRGESAGQGGATGAYAEGEGVFIRGPMRSVEEISRMDIPATLMRARSRHPKVRHLLEDDVVIHREERIDLLHVVVIVDRSGSMEEHGRMEAAKRATLALHHAVRQRNPRNPVDVLLMDTSVRPASLRDVWTTSPRGFTNTGTALRLARELISRRKTGRSLVYLVTDGLPEAYTKDGEDVAGHPERAMKHAKAQARLLAREPGFSGLVMLLLEPEDEMYVKAADSLAAEADGRVVPVSPQELTGTLLRQFEKPSQRVKKVVA